MLPVILRPVRSGALLIPGLTAVTALATDVLIGVEGLVISSYFEVDVRAG